ncbi:MAG TPA: hypothetical protein VFG35_09730 [Actinoplanes sp.]|nr:hypothetical protein [Actinoplanes sp.]
MDHLADRLDEAAETLTALSRDVPSLSVAPHTFGAVPALSGAGGGAPGPGSAEAGPGLPGQVGQALCDRWTAVLDARGREASSAAVRLAEMAHSVRTTRRRYAETDEAAERRFTQEW